MVRVIKRYGSRKLYDTEESRYVSLDEIAAWVRDGQEVRVLDNDSGEDVTGPTLTQVIVEEGRKGSSAFSPAFLHDLIRRGERAMSSGVERIQKGADRILEAGLDRVGPLRRAREEMSVLRARIERLEATLNDLDERRGAAGAPSDDDTPGTAPEGEQP